MNKIKSLSEKRLLIEGTISGKKAYFLLDTGASVSLIDENQKRRYDLKEGRRYNGSLIGAGGDIKTAYMCNNTVLVNGNKPIGQFIMSDISNIKESIRQQTGYEILGIIGLPVMKQVGIQLDLNDNLIIFE